MAILCIILVMECNIKLNLKNCACTYDPCPRKGRCCDCLRYHLNMNELPACCFPAEVERTYDRSFKQFIKMQGR